MSPVNNRQVIADEEHLKLLYWGYIISGAFAAMFSFLGLFYVAMGTMMGLIFSKAAETASKPDVARPAFMGVIFAGIGVVFFVVAARVAILKFVTAHDLRRRKSKVFCMVIAGFSCLEIPYGTLLGVMTFIVLGRESVAKLFAVRSAGSSPAS